MECCDVRFLCFVTGTPEDRPGSDSVTRAPIRRESRTEFRDECVCFGRSSRGRTRVATRHGHQIRGRPRISVSGGREYNREITCRGQGRHRRRSLSCTSDTRLNSVSQTAKEGRSPRLLWETRAKALGWPKLVSGPRRPAAQTSRDCKKHGSACSFQPAGRPWLSTSRYE